MNILLFGPPGAGKGTQSEFLVKKLGMCHISTGNLFRSAIKKKTNLGQEAQAYMDKGELVPDDVVIGMVEERLSESEVDNFILDGFPRTGAQAIALNGMLEVKNMNLDKAIFLQVESDVLLRRLSGRRTCKGCGAVYHVDSDPSEKEGICNKCGGEVVQRVDDGENVIQNRLDAYKKNTSPLIDFYKNDGRYLEVDGQGETLEVFTRIKRSLGV